MIVSAITLAALTGRAPLERGTIRGRGKSGPPHRPRRVVPRAREERRAHARGLGARLRRRGAAVRGLPRRRSEPACTWSRATARSSRSRRSRRRARCGSTTRTSTSPTTCATRRCRRPRARSSCGSWPAACSRSSSTARKPLWEIWLVDRVGDDDFALICKTHHALVDGISGVDIMTVLFDLEPEPPEREPGPAWYPRPEPSGSSLFGDAVRERAATPVDAARAAAGVVTRSARGGGGGGDAPWRASRRWRPPGSEARRRARSTRASARTGASPGWRPSSTASRRSRARSAAPSTTSCWRS